MTYEELQAILRMNKAGQAAPTGLSIDQIISGIQGQYMPTNAAPQYMQPIQNQGMYGASRFIDPSIVYQEPVFNAIGNQLPTFKLGEFDKTVYEKVDTQKLYDLISQIDSGGYGGDGSNSPVGNNNSTPSTVSPAAVTIGAMALSAVTGLPIGLVTSLVGPQNIADAMNAAVVNAAISQANIDAANAIGNTAPDSGPVGNEGTATGNDAGVGDAPAGGGEAPSVGD
jgi:hypothetical protein